MRPRKPSTHIVGEKNNHVLVLKDIYKVLRGNISYGRQGFNANNTALDLVSDNIDGNFGSTTDSGLANIEFAITHNLNRVPIGFHTVRRDKAASFYDSGTAWTTTQIFLKCDTANVAATFFIF